MFGPLVVDVVPFQEDGYVFTKGESTSKFISSLIRCLSTSWKNLAHRFAIDRFRSYFDRLESDFPLDEASGAPPK